MQSTSPAGQPSVPSSRRPLVRALLVAALVVFAAGWWAFRPDRLFTTTTVADAAPVAVSAPPTSAATPATMTPAAATPAAEPPVAVTPVSALPDTSPATLARGRFHSNAHETVGTATVLDLGAGRRVLRLTGFRTSNGPDVRVVLVAAADVTDDATAPRVGYVEVGKLRGTRGDQNYEVPASVDLARYRTVTIWCERFDVNFGSAPLTGA
jgi:zona occludens toxin (predicted ATPase)